MKSENAKKYLSILIIALMILTVFTVSFSVIPSATASSNIQETTITKSFSVSLNDVKEVVGPNGERYLIVNGLQLERIPGKPVIPMKVMNFELPSNAKVTSLQVKTGDIINYGKTKISPAPYPVLKTKNRNIIEQLASKYDKRVYSMNAFYPEKNYAYFVGHSNDKTVVNVFVYPVKYNPVSGEVKIYTQVTVTVNYEINAIRARAPSIDVPNIIITSPELKEEAQRLADFHNSTGITSWVVTTDWISANYEEAEKPPVKGYGDAYTDKYDNVLIHNKLPLKHDNIIGYDFSLAKKIISFLRDETGGNVKYVTIFGNARMVSPSYYWVDQYMYLIAYYAPVLGIAPDYYDAWIPTDAFYASPDYNSTSFDYIPNFRIGRIPVNPLTAKIVVDKIIYYGEHKSGGIHNLTLSGGQVFETPYFLGETGVVEPLNYGWLDGLKVTEYFHTLRNYTFDNFIKMMYESDMIIEITHGSGFSIWHHNDEVSAWDLSMNTSYGSLPIYVSGSCLNGAWDEEVYPAYEMSSGINGGTSIAEKMIYSPMGAIAFLGGDREAYGSTFAYFDNGTLIAPNDFGDLITEDGTSYGYYRALNDSGEVYLGDLYYWAIYKYPSWVRGMNNINISDVDPYDSGLNDNPWARSYFEYSLLGDPALKIGGSSVLEPAYSVPQVEIPNANYNSQKIPIVGRDQEVTVNISTTSPHVKVVLVYLEHDEGYSPYVKQNEETYYDFIVDNRVLANSGGNITYKFTPQREGIYIVSVYGDDGKNTRLYILCEKPTAPPLKVMLKKSPYSMFYSSMPRATKASSNVQVVTIMDYEDIKFGRYTNATAVLYNSGDTDAMDVTVSFYLENYNLIFEKKDLSSPIVELGSTTANVPAHGYAYATISWEAHNLYEENPDWDPTHSSARWQYFVANAKGNANWALFRVHLDVDVWAQKVFIEKEPVYNESNNITIELTNVGTSQTSQTTVVVKDKFGIINETSVNIAPGETKFLKIPWTPQGYGVDEISVNTTTVGDINVRNDNSSYYPNGYDSVSQFKVLYYDISPINISQDDMNLTVQIYNYGPSKSTDTTVDVYQIPGAYLYHLESPHPYPDNYDHTWTVEISGAKEISLHFKYIDVEKGYDYLYIKDANNKVVAKYSGYYSDVWTPVVKGSIVHIQLTSDVAVNYTGFYIDLYCLGKPTSLYIGKVSFSPVDSGKYEKVSIPISHIVAGPSAFKLVAKGKGDIATFSTGGEGNNYATIPFTVEESDNTTSIPEISLIAPTAGTVVYNSVVVWLHLNDTIGAVKYAGNVTVDGKETNAEFTLTSNWTLKGTIKFSSDGDHTISLYVRDSADHVSNTVSFHVKSDTISPVVTITSPTQGKVIGSSSVTIQWSINEANLDYIEISGVKEKISADKISYSFSDLKDGKYNITVTAFDKVGNKGSAWVEFTVDTTSPVLEITAPSNNSILNNREVNITWSVNDATLKKVSLWVDSNTPEDVTDLDSKSFTLQEGTHTIHIKAEDSVGHIVTKWITLTVDTTAPEVKSSTPQSGSNISEDNIQITIVFSEKVNASTLQYHITGGNYSIEISWESDYTKLIVKLTNLEPGKTYKFIIDSVTDQAGNKLTNYVYVLNTESKGGENISGGAGIGALEIGIIILIIVIIPIVALRIAKKKKQSENMEEEEVEEVPEETEEEVTEESHKEG